MALKQIVDTVKRVNRKRFMLLLSCVASLYLLYANGSWESASGFASSVYSARLDVAAERYAETVGKSVFEIQIELREIARKTHEADLAAGVPNCDDGLFWSREKCTLFIPNSTFLLAPPVDDWAGWIAAVFRATSSLMPMLRDITIAIVASFLFVFAAPFGLTRVWSWLMTTPG